MRKMVRVSAVALCAIMAVVCAGCVWPSEQKCYDVACQTMSSDTNFPKNAVIYPLEKSRVYVCKSAGYVEVYYDYVSEGGAKQTDSYTVWLKRIGRDWRLDYYYRTPKY